MNKSSILRRYLEAVSPGLNDRISRYHVFFFGAGGSGKSFFSMYPELSPTGFIDNSPELWGRKVSDVTVYSPTELANYDPQLTAIFITSDYRTEILKQLRALGFGDKVHRLAGRPAAPDFDDIRSLFFESFESLYSALSSCSRKKSLVILRDYEDFPHSPRGDVDVVADEDSFADLSREAHGKRPIPGAYRLDVSLVGQFKRESYPARIKDFVLRDSVQYGSVFIPNRWSFTAAFVYHTVFHKSPLFTGIDESNCDYNMNTKYTRTLESVLDVLGLGKKALTQESLISALVREGWSPDIAEVKRIARIQEEHCQGNGAMSRWAAQ